MLGDPRRRALRAAGAELSDRGHPRQLQVKGDFDAGVRHEPGYHSSIDTIGDITPLQIPGPRVSAP